ncbi:TPA: phospholipid carrier-dependent glycosyltransferase [Candidatus Bathyarchaeota archaeon]|nr:phospholipid carrier-dependent glycosyltransferase [Candidatus Bathyarchaeota archaeon]
MVIELPSKFHDQRDTSAESLSTESASKFVDKFGKWRLALLIFTIIYAALLLLDLGYMWIQWDEMPHLYGGLLLSRGQTHEYLTTYGYYPPLYDFVTTGYYRLLEVSVFSGRLAAVTFSIASIWVVFEFANRFYRPQIALLSSVMLATMPGFFWASRAAMLETTLVFFFSLSMFFFLTWIKTKKDISLVLGCLSLGIGFLAKYQIVVAGIVLLVCIPLLFKDKLRMKYAKFLLVPIIAVAVVVPWVAVLYQSSGTIDFGEIIYAMRVGGEDRAQYSGRFAAPIFYLVEMTWPFNDIPVHPISLPIYLLGLLGLGLFAWRRKTEDKFLLIWFVVVYVFFTLIPNKQWRYVTPLFPVLAISAAGLVFFAYRKISEALKKENTSLNRKRLLKAASVLLVILTISSIAYSSYNAYQMVARDQIHIPIEEATNYAIQNMKENESIVVLSPFNLYNGDMVRFYLQASEPRSNQILQYPELPVDSFTPDFNMTALTMICQEKNVKYLLLYEYGGNLPYFNSNLTAMDVYIQLIQTGRIACEHRVGNSPRTITIFAFSH